jgi:hypothetical protein
MKKFLMFALATTMFAACGKDDEKPANPAVLTNPQAPYLLYWDGARMQVGQWGRVTQNNILFTQFGSAVAFTATSDQDSWDAGDVKFNPTGASYEDYSTIPHWNGSSTEDGYISSAEYHTLANVKAGRGDICKLAGLTKADIDAGVYDNGKFRLPTDAENVATYPDNWNGDDDVDAIFPWTETPAPGRWFASDPTANTFLPAAGYRANTTGAVYSQGTYGYYWSATPISDTLGYYLGFYGALVYPSDYNNYSYGFSVRCVPQ